MPCAMYSARRAFFGSEVRASLSTIPSRQGRSGWSHGVRSITMHTNWFECVQLAGPTFTSPGWNFPNLGSALVTDSVWRSMCFRCGWSSNAHTFPRAWGLKPELAILPPLSQHPAAFISAWSRLAGCIPTCFGVSRHCKRCPPSWKISLIWSRMYTCFVSSFAFSNCTMSALTFA